MTPEARVTRVAASLDSEEKFGNADYMDAFEARLVRSDARPAITWLHAGLEGSPAALRWLIVMVHRHVLRFRPCPESGDHMLGLWRIARCEDDEAWLAADGPLIKGRLVARRLDPRTVRLVTFVTFNRRRAAPIVWALVGPVHRRVAPHLMKRAARAASTHDHEDAA